VKFESYLKTATQNACETLKVCTTSHKSYTI